MPYGPFTLEIVARPDVIGKAMSLFSDACGVSLTLQADGHLCAVRRKATLTSREALSAGRWVHLATVYDGERLRLYIDAKRDAEVSSQKQVMRINSLPVLGNSTALDAGFQGLLGGFHLQCGVLTPERFVLSRRQAQPLQTSTKP